MEIGDYLTSYGDFCNLKVGAIIKFMWDSNYKHGFVGIKIDEYSVISIAESYKKHPKIMNEMDTKDFSDNDIVYVGNAATMLYSIFQDDKIYKVLGIR